MEYVISIIPIVLYLLGIKAMDALSFTTWRRLSVCILAGMTACAMAFLCSMAGHWDTPGLMPLIEETFKSLFIIYLVYPSIFHRTLFYKGSRDGAYIAFFAEAWVYGMATGAGFSLVENVVYVMFNDDITLLECSIRGFGTALIHMGCTALVATILTTLARIRRCPAIVGIIVAIAVACGIHTLYNAFLLPAFVQLLVTVVAFIALFMVLFMIEERLIANWLDVSVSDDIKLLGAIKEGRLADTRSGQYLLQVREQFHPEVFFDMLVLLQLYLELSVKAKSRLMLKEAGLAPPIDSVAHDNDLARIKELTVLRNNIGVAGRSVLAPLIHVKEADRWVINELL